MGMIFFALAFVTSYFGGRFSLSTGIGTVVGWGYAYGIVRANFPDSFSHFIFDAAVVGFYLARLVKPPRFAGSPALEVHRRWFYALMIWPVIMFCIPLQPMLIQAVGLRGNGFLLPFLFIGMWLQGEDAVEVAYWLATLNFVALAFALGEFLWGVPAFFPENAVTKIIYASDLGPNTHRIPSTFVNSHTYGGTMVATLPWLLGAWVQPKLSQGQRMFFTAAMIAALFGVFLCAARIHVVGLVVLIVAASFSGQLKGGFGAVWVIMLLGIGYLVSNQERLQRFATLGETDAVVGRIRTSVNMEFFELLAKYPLGNGMGAGGTSIPFFLQHLLREPVGLESEYSRILLEQGLIGLVLWIAFIIWVISRRPTNPHDPWQLGKTLSWWLSIVGFAGALLGTGLLTSIPHSPLLLMGLGFCVTPHFRRKPVVRAPNRELAHSGMAVGNPV